MNWFRGMISFFPIWSLNGLCMFYHSFPLKQHLCSDLEAQTRSRNSIMKVLSCRGIFTGSLGWLWALGLVHATQAFLTGRAIVGANKPSHRLVCSYCCSGTKHSYLPWDQLLPSFGAVNAHMVWFVLRDFHWHKLIVPTLQSPLCHHISSI